MDRGKVKGTISNMESLKEVFDEKQPEKIIISSPHTDWGFNVPLFFLAGGFEGDVEDILTGMEEPVFYFEKGKQKYGSIADTNERIALIASGDLSHRLKEDGPYGYHPDGERFDDELISSLEKGDIENILSLHQKFPEAGECGLRSFSFLLGVLDAHRNNVKKDPGTDIMSYENPFGVGYLVVNFDI